MALNSIGDALKEGKDGSKPALILFMDTTEKSKLFAEVLGEKDLDEAFGKVTYAAVVFERGSDEAKKYSVSSAPTLVIVDPSHEEPKVIKSLKSSSAKTVKTEIDAAVKKIAKK